jgi:hypothetical protein
MKSSARELPNEPAINRSKSKFAAAGALTHTGGVIENPAHFAARKVRVNNQAGFAPD